MFDYIVLDYILFPFMIYLVIGVVVGVIVTALCEPFPNRHQRLLSNIVFTLAWPLAIVCGVLSFAAYEIGRQYIRKNEDDDDIDDSLKERNRLIAQRAAKAVAAAHKIAPVSETEQSPKSEPEPKPKPTPKPKEKHAFIPHWEREEDDT